MNKFKSMIINVSCYQIKVLLFVFLTYVLHCIQLFLHFTPCFTSFHRCLPFAVIRKETAILVLALLRDHKDTEQLYFVSM